MPERVPLSFLLAQIRDEQPPVEAVVPFEAWREVESTSTQRNWLPITVTAVLERTATFYGDGGKYETGLLRLEVVLVDPEQVKWRPLSPKQLAGRREGQSAAKGRKAAIRGHDGSSSQALARQIKQRQENDRLLREDIAAQRVALINPADASLGAFEETSTMPVGTSKPKAPKTCTACGNEKPRDQFPPTGVNARRCYACADVKKPAAPLGLVKVTAILSPPVPEPPVYAEGALSQIQGLIVERNELRAQLDAIQGALALA